MITHDVQPSSLEAFVASENSRQRNRERILEYLAKNPGSTNREMEEALKMRGTSLTSAVHYLRGTDEVEKDETADKPDGYRECSITGHWVLSWRVTNRSPRPFRKKKLQEIRYNDGIDDTINVLKKMLADRGFGENGKYSAFLTAFFEYINSRKYPEDRQPRERKKPEMYEPQKPEATDGTKPK